VISPRARRGIVLTGVVAVAVAVTLGLGLGLGGCGDDGELPLPPPPKPAKPSATPPVAGQNGKAQQLAEKPHIEDRVRCPVPDKPTDPKDGKCDPKAPSCAEHLYCLALAQGSFCEPCPERDLIRHAFKDRDFAVEQNRDPFQSFLLPRLSVGKPSDAVPLDPTKKCLREDQMVATSYSYAELRLVGIVAQGTQRKVLMMGGPLGYIIKRGDCVGKEKAVVKDIGTGYITFLIDPDGSGMSQRAPEEYSVKLNPKQLAVNDPDLPVVAPRSPVTPIAPRRAGSGAVVMPPIESPPAVPRKP